MSVRLATVCVLGIGTLFGALEARAQSATPDPAPAPAEPAAPVPGQPPTAAPAVPAPPSTAPAAPSTTAPTAPPVTAQPAAPPAGQGTPATVLSMDDSDGIIGKSVRSATGEDMGRIVDVIVTGATQPRAAVIDFGGFLGVGSRKVAVDWRSVQFATDGKAGRITVALTRNQVRATPEYKAGEPIVVIGAPARDPATPDGAPAKPAP